MAKLTIIGNATPEIGTQNQYSIISLGFNALSSSYNNPFSAQKPAQAEWNIYVLENRTWRKTRGTTKYGDTIPYTFTQKSLTRKGIKLKVKKGEDSGELILKPKSTGKPKIIRIDLLDVNGNKVVKPLSYMDTLVAKAYCTDMEGQTLHFTLWEDDAEGPGHNPINEKNKINIFPVPAIVKKGVAKAQFNMAQYTMASIIANMQIAKGDKDEGKTHEYYVTAEYFGKMEASNNVNIKNPTYNPHQKIPVNKGSTKPQNKTKLPNKNPVPIYAPKKDTYKVPVTSGSKTKAPDPKGKITKVSFVDVKGNPVTNLKTSSGVIAKIETKDMVGRSVKLTIWEEDALLNDKIWSELVKITKDVCYKGIPITIDMWKKGDDGGDSSTQEYFLEVEYAGENIKSTVVTVDKDAPRTKIEIGRSMQSVGKNPKEKKADKTSPNCEKDITLEQIKRICVDARGKSLIKDDTMIKKSLPYLNQYKNKVGLTTCVSKAHFIAQICQESKFYILQEAFKYSDPERMRRTFYSYFKQFGSIEKQRQESKRLSEISFKTERWPEVANAIYGKTNPSGKKHILPDDGWRYSGKGFKQITWKDNYEKLEKYAKSKLGLDVKWTDDNNPNKLKENPMDAMVSALAFWGYNNISEVATEISDTGVLTVTKKINPYLEGANERIKYFNKAVEILKVKECKFKGKASQEKASQGKGTVVLVSGTDKVPQDDLVIKGLKWMMYKTSVYRNMNLARFKELKTNNKLPVPNYVTYLSRDAHQSANAKRTEFYKHSDKRFGTNNEIPPGEYFLVPAVKGQRYLVYVIDSESKSADSLNGIDGPDGPRGGVAIHHFSPRGSLGCFTFNSGKKIKPVKISSNKFQI